MGDRVRSAAVVTTFVSVAAVMAAILVFSRLHSAQIRPVSRALPAAVSNTPRSSRLTHADRITVNNAVRLRRMALTAGRTAYYRAFAAYMALSGLTRLHPIRPGRCAVAISYLYDNLLDLSHAYPGEDWRPLRRLIRKQPSLRVCEPKTVPHVTYVS